MSMVVGGSSSGMSYGGDGGRYGNYNNTNYNKASSKTESYGLNSNIGVYGDYGYSKSTLDKYKSDKPGSGVNKSMTVTSSNKSSIVPE